MLKEEARWVEGALAGLSSQDLFPLVDVGSSTLEVRTVDQPWIEELVFGPLRRRGKVLHQDMKPREGVDLVGDLADPIVRTELRALGIRSVLCSNVLEHIPEDVRVQACHAIADLVAPGGHLLITVPHAFPYHPDPIDTLFRPCVAEVVSLFPTLEMVRGEVVRGSTVWGLMERNVRRLTKKALHRARDGDQAATGRSGSLRQWLVPWAWRRFEITCVLLTRSPDR